MSDLDDLPNRMGNPPAKTWKPSGRSWGKRSRKSRTTIYRKVRLDKAGEM